MSQKICLLDTGKEWGGGTNSMLELLKRLDRSRFSVHGLFYQDYRQGNGALLSEILRDIGISSTILPPLPQPPWAKLGKELARGIFKPWPKLRRQSVDQIEQAWRILPRAAQIQAFLSAGNFDLLYMNNQPESNREGYLAARALALPALQHCRIEPELTPASRDLANGAAKIIAVSDGVAARLQAEGVGRVVVVNNGIDVQQKLPDRATARASLDFVARGIFPADKIAVTVGQLIRRKGVGDILTALVALPDWRLAVVGAGPFEANLREQAARLGVADRVLWVGFSPQALSWVCAADLFILASEREGLPRVVLEAMLCARPIIATDIAGTRDVMRHGETGILYPFGAVSSLIAAWQQLDQSPKLAAQYAAAARARVIEHFSIERYVAGVEAVFAEVLHLKN